MIAEPIAKKQVECFHCGEDCVEELIRYDDKNFCCQGCKAVYELFLDTDLQEVYANRKVFRENSHKYEYLNNPGIESKLLDFQSESHNKVKLFLPAVHCSSCIYVLENLHRLEEGVIKVTLNFIKKEADIHYDPRRLSLEKVAELLASIGYPPKFSTESTEKKQSSTDHLSIKIGIAAFCFGNIMLLSFPEYLGFEDALDEVFGRFFSWINILLAIPVVLYSGRDYFISAWKGLAKKFINIDVPIALGILVLFSRSSYEVLSHTGPGYFDSLAGLVFFLLIGKWFQSKTYQSLSFERDYRSYFPLAVLKETGNGPVSTPIQDLVPGDTIMIRNEEIIPADAILLNGEAKIDYSFVTGEADAVTVLPNEVVYAGGRQMGERLTLKLTRKSSHSYLTGLWNNQVFKTERQGYSELLVNKISKHFTLVVISLATIAALYWLFYDKTEAWQVFTAVLIVACPCALALSAPFTNGNSLRILGRNKFYLKKANIAEYLAAIDTLVFDKTGTITEAGKGRAHYRGEALEEWEKAVVAQMTSNSIHPLSKKIHSLYQQEKEVDLDRFTEKTGKGLHANYEGHQVRLGSGRWLGVGSHDGVDGRVYLEIDGNLKGCFEISSHYREGLRDLVAKLKKNVDLFVLSGDNDKEREDLKKIFGPQVEMRFEQSPEDKLKFIEKLRNEGRKVMMLGDGLNDAGALKQSDVGIAVTDDIAAFSPACDGILLGDELDRLYDFIQYTKKAKRIIIASFMISFAYNLVGVTLAVCALLTPIAAAILMPVSSISVVIFTTLSGNLQARRQKLL